MSSEAVSSSVQDPSWVDGRACARQHSRMGSPNPERNRLLLSDEKRIYDWYLDHPDWGASVLCQGCNWSWTVFVQDWVRCRNPPNTVEDLKLRLSCSKCGGRRLQLDPRFVGMRR